MTQQTIIGEPLPNIPWEERPADARHPRVVWRSVVTRTMANARQARGSRPLPTATKPGESPVLGSRDSTVTGSGAGKYLPKRGRMIGSGRARC